MRILQKEAKSNRMKAMGSLVLASILWSTGGLFIKMIPWHPAAISSFRGGVSFLTLMLFWRIRNHRWPGAPSREVLWAAISYAVLTNSFVIANKLTTSANAILLQYTAPAWVLLFSKIFLKEKIKIRDVFVVFLIFFGMTLFFIDSLSVGSLAGDLLSVFSGAMMAAMILLMRNVKRGTPLETVIWGNLISFFIGMGFYRGVVFTPSSIGAGIYMGVFQLGAAYLFYTFAISKVSAMEAILIPAIEPLLNPLWVYLGTRERPSGFAVIGGSIVIAAVLLRSIAENADERKQKYSRSDSDLLKEEE